MAHALNDLGVESVQDVIEGLYGLSGEIRGDEYDMYCPNPNHIDSHPSCSVNLESGYWNCFACGVGGDLVKLGTIVLRSKRDEVTRLLKPSSPDALLTLARRKISRISMGQEPSRKALELPGPYEQIDIPYLRKRGFTSDTIRRFDIRYCREQTLQGKRAEFTITNALAIPIRDASGRLMAWCYRATDDSPRYLRDLRYIYTPGAELSELWFGLQHATSVPHVSVVEGALDAAWLDQNNFPALALLGSKMGDRKILSLQRYKSVTLLADLDNAGRLWVNRIGAMIGGRVPLYVAQYRSWMMSAKDARGRATDPQELFPVDLEIVHATKLPWHLYRLRYAG